MFHKIAGCLSFNIVGSIVVATCKGLYSVLGARTAQGTVVRGGAVQVSAVALCRCLES